MREKHFRFRAFATTKSPQRKARAAAMILALFSASLAGVARGQVPTEYPLLTANFQPVGIASGPDGNLWCTGIAKIARITPAGVITEFTVPGSNRRPAGITAGPDGNLWFVEQVGGNVGRITPAGVITEFPVPTISPGLWDITTGPDGNLWFTESTNEIGRITTAGVITEFPIPTALAQPINIIAGPDGNLWFVEHSGNKIGRITTAGAIIEFPIPSPNPHPVGITLGPDGNLWYTEENPNKVARMTLAGDTVEFPAPTGPGSLPQYITTGPDGNLWFTQYGGHNVVRMTPDGDATAFPLPTPLNGGHFITPGPDGRVWYPQSINNKIGAITMGPTTPQSMAVDTAAVTGSSSNTNGVLEPGETVQVAPVWENTLVTPQSFGGVASDLTGPPGPTYTLDDSFAGYGTVAGGAPSDCAAAPGGCYLTTVSGTRPGQHWDATFTETLTPSVTPTEASAGTSLAVKTWEVHLGESFPDVPTSNPFYAFIENLFHNGVTGGCAGGGYCPTNSVTRAQMAVFLMKSRLGAAKTPPPATGAVFADVPESNPFASWIEQLAGFQITGGCGGGNYCPGNPVTRGQMAVFLLKSKHGSAYTPPDCTSLFADVACPSPFANWIEQLANENITGGCGGGNYCPGSPVTRGQMAVFLVKTFGLALYGP